MTSNKGLKRDDNILIYRAGGYIEKIDDSPQRHYLIVLTNDILK